MAIPKIIKIKNGKLPQQPGVYFMKDAAGRVLYVGKAASLKSRVESYFGRPHDSRIDEMVSKIARIDYQVTPTALDALLLEARIINTLKPFYNIQRRDDKSFLFVVFLREDYPKPLLLRLPELRIARKQKKILAEFGPFLSAASLRASLDILRKIFPWCECEPPRAGKIARPCFYYHLKQCPGVCVGAITRTEYRKIVYQLVQFFKGKRKEVERAMQKEMDSASKALDFEKAALVRNRLHNLQHIRDINLIKRDFYDDLSFGQAIEGTINMAGRVEAYDISNISGQYAVGSMVVFEHGVPKKSEYKKFKIKTVKGANDVAMIYEVLHRRFAHVPGGEHEAWPMPELILIDGGIPQLKSADRALANRRVHVPIISLAKGITRKGVTFVYVPDPELDRIAKEYKNLLIQLRDEAHRFAIAYYRKRHRKSLVVY